MGASKARSNGEGSLYKMKRADGREVWRADSTTYRNGQRKVVSGTGPTRQIALERLERNKLKQEVLAGLRPASDLEDRLPIEWRVTVGEWMLEVLDRKVKNKRKPLGEQTAAGYEAKVRLHVNGKNGIGHIPLRLLTPAQAQKFMDETLPAKKKSNGAPLLSQGVIRSIYFMLREACDIAVAEERLLANPFRTVEIPEKHPPRVKGVAKLKSWVPHHLLQKIEGTDDEARWMLGFMGLRQSEVLGLTDDSIILGKNPRIIINQQLARHPTKHGCAWDGSKWECGRQADKCPKRIGDGGLYLKQKTKTVSSERTLPLVEPFASVLKEHMRRQRELRKSPNFAPLPGEGMDKLIFTKATGTPRRQQDDTKAWTQLLADNGVPHMRGHLQRHIMVSILDAMGVPHGRIRDITGWSDTSMMKVYSEIAPSDLVDPLTQFGAAISNRRGKASVGIVTEVTE